MVGRQRERKKSNENLPVFLVLVRRKDSCLRILRACLVVADVIVTIATCAAVTLQRAEAGNKDKPQISPPLSLADL